MARLTTLLIVSFASAAGAVPGLHASAHFNRALAESYGWEPDLARPAAASELVPITLVLAHDEAVESSLSQALARVSDPKSPGYGQHAKRADLGSLFPPRTGAVAAAKVWTESAGASAELIGSGDLVAVTGLTVQDVEELFGVEIVAMSRGTQRILRTADDFEVPTPLAGYVDLVHGISTWPALRTNVQSTAALGSPARRSSRLHGSWR